MKKILLIVFAAMFAVQSFAQDDDLSLVVASSDDEKVKFEMISHMGYGFHIVKSDDFDPKTAGEFFINIADLKLYPIEQFGFEIGIDLLLNHFNQKNSMFFVDNSRIIQNSLFVDTISGYDKLRTGFTTVSFNAPVLAKGKFGKFEIGAGIDGSWNLTGNTWYRYKSNGHRTEVRENKGKVNSLTYGLLATVSYDGFGIYFRYRPKSQKLLPEGSLDFTYMTVGVAFDF